MLTAVLNYPTGNVDIFNIPDDLDMTEKIERWLEETCGYKLEDIYYMVDAGINYRSDLNQLVTK